METCRASSPLVSFIIPAYNEEGYLGGTLSAVEAIRETLDLDSETIVVDNNSTDRTAEIAEKGGALVVGEPENCIAKARNRGAEQASGRYLFFIDADTIAGPALVKAALDGMESGRLCGGGSIVEFEGERLPGLIRVFAATWHLLIKIFPMAAGSFVFCRRDAWRETGGFNEEVYASEEIGFSRRLARWGRKRKMKFRVIGIPVVTSARKIEQYSVSKLLCTMLLVCIFPFLLRSRKACSIWYERL